MQRVLMLSTSLSQAEHLHKLLSKIKLRDVEFRYPSTLTKDPIDLQTLLRDCIQVIKDEEVTSVVSVHPGLQLVQSAILERFPHLKGASFDSVFLCLHRHYTRDIILCGFCPSFKTLNCSEEISDQTIDVALEEIGVPCLLRESYNLEGSFSKKLRNKLFFQKDFTNAQTRALSTQVYLNGFLSPFLKKNSQYSDARESSILVEQYIRPGRNTGTQHIIEACIVDGDVIPWSICDVSYYKLRPFVVRYTTAPSSLDDSRQYEMWAVFREVAQRLIQRGFDNQFLQMDVIVSPSNTVRVLDVTPCLNCDNIPLLRHVFADGDPLKAQVEASLGRVPYTPGVLGGRGALRASLCCQVYNVTLQDVINLKDAEDIPNLTLLHTDDEFSINSADSGEDGVVLASMQLTDRSVALCTDVMKAACKRVLKPFAPRPGGESVRGEKVVMEEVNRKRVDEERVGEERLNEEKVGGEKVNGEKVGEERVDEEKVGGEKVNGEKVGEETVDKVKVGGERAGHGDRRRHSESTMTLAAKGRTERRLSTLPTMSTTTFH